RVARTGGIREAILSVAPDVMVEEVDVVGPPTSSALRAAGWAEAAVLVAAAGARAPDPVEVRSPWGSVARAELEDDRIRVWVSCGAPLDEITLRSYCIGAAHMGLSWVTSEGIAVDEGGQPADLTIHSFGIVPARDMPFV